MGNKSSFFVVLFLALLLLPRSSQAQAGDEAAAPRPVPPPGETAPAVQDDDPEAAAREPEAEQQLEEVQRGYDLRGSELALGASLLKEYGFGLVLRLFTDPIGIELGAAYMPWIFMLQGDCQFFDFSMEQHLAGSLLIRLVNFRNDRMRVLLKLGGDWHENVGYGVRGGAAFDLHLSRHFFLDFGLGLMIVPGAADELEEIAARECPGGMVNEADKAISMVQLYLGTNLFLRF